MGLPSSKDVEGPSGPVRAFEELARTTEPDVVGLPSSKDVEGPSGPVRASTLRNRVLG